MMESPEQESYDYLFKLVLVGDSAVGKSSLMTRFTRNEFNLESKSTIGVEFSTKQLQFLDHKIRAQIWDTAGQERYRAITSAFYRGALGALLVYDITKSGSFKNLQRWLKEMRDNADPNMVVLMVGNKLDLGHRRAVSTEDAQAFAENEGLSYMETSALDTTNVEEAFQTVLMEIYKFMRKKTVVHEEANNTGVPKKCITIDVSSDEPAEKQARCCV